MGNHDFAAVPPYLVTLEKAARAAGLAGDKTRQMSLPESSATLENYGHLGLGTPSRFGDVETVATF